MSIQQLDLRVLNSELKSLLARRKGTKSELANAVKVPSAYVSRRFRDGLDWPIDELAAAAEFLGTSVVDLLAIASQSCAFEAGVVSDDPAVRPRPLDTLGRGIKYDPFMHAALLGLTASWERMDGPSVWGYYVHTERTVVLNYQLSSLQSRSTMAHEVQHALHGDVPMLHGPKHDARERRTECLAAAMLIDPLEFLEVHEQKEGRFIPMWRALNVAPRDLRVWLEMTGQPVPK